MFRDPFLLFNLSPIDIIFKYLYSVGLYGISVGQVSDSSYFLYSLLSDSIPVGTYTLPMVLLPTISL